MSEMKLDSSTETKSQTSQGIGAREATMKNQWIAVALLACGPAFMTGCPFWGQTDSVRVRSGALPS